MTDSFRGSRRRGQPLGRMLVVLVVLALALAACGSGRDDADDDGGGGGSGTTVPGGAAAIDTADCQTDPANVTIEGDTIKLGTSIPQSGLYASFKEILNGETAYIDYLNEVKGGVDIAGKKYKIELVSKDDAYEASKTVTNVNELISKDNVFGFFDVVGTKNNAAIRGNINDRCIPNLFAATGSPLWGNRDYPWTIGTFLVPYPLEMQALVDYLKENKPQATIAVLYANDDFGRSYLETLQKLVEGTELKVVKSEGYNPEQFDTKTQITSLAATNADVLVIGATLLACPDAMKNVASTSWKPIQYMSGTCTSKTLMDIAKPAGDGVISVSPAMDPNDPAFADNENMQLYKEQVPKYAPDADIGNGIVAYGWTVGAMLELSLSKATAPNRLAVMEAARGLTDIQNIGLQLPGTTWSVNSNDWFFGEEFTMVQYSAADQYFKPIGEIQKFDDKTEDITPPALINGG
jgi:branched-chain amino acid transport system substrate-binding protein